MSAPVLLLAGAIATALPCQGLAAAIGRGLPLKYGAYAEAGSRCDEAGSSDLSWFGGGYVIQAPHVRCTLKAVRRVGKTDYRVVEHCLENAEPAVPFRLVNRIHIVSPRRYRLTNRNGQFAARWCRD